MCRLRFNQMRLRVIFTLVVTGSVTLLSQSSLHRVPQNFRSIQFAINAARVGDTVLVDHGIYYENVRINKNIVLASRFILDGDTAHISKTIIDGSRPVDERNASVVTVLGRTDSNCVVIGFTIRRGTGMQMMFPDDSLSRNWIAGGGVNVVHAGARISHNIVTENILSEKKWSAYTYGAGIGAADTSNGKSLPPIVIIEDNVAVRNISSGKWGEAAGIGLYQPGVIRRNIVVENRATSQSRSPAGGMAVRFTADYDIVVEGNYICRNVGGVAGGYIQTMKMILTK